MDFQNASEIIDFSYSFNGSIDYNEYADCLNDLVFEELNNINGDPAMQTQLNEAENKLDSELMKYFQEYQQPQQNAESANYYVAPTPETANNNFLGYGPNDGIIMEQPPYINYCNLQTTDSNVKIEAADYQGTFQSVVQQPIAMEVANMHYGVDLTNAQDVSNMSARNFFETFMDTEEMRHYPQQESSSVIPTVQHAVISSAPVQPETQPSLPRIQCDECSKTFSKPKYLSQHKNFVHIESDLICSQCKKKFLTKEKLEEHVKRHSDNHKRFQCTASDCLLKFTTKQSMQRHYTRKHDRENMKYSCSVCALPFNRKDHLLSHEKTHQKVKKVKKSKKVEKIVN